MLNPFPNLTPLHYGCVLADPPWRFANYSAKGEAKNPVAHYGCMSATDLAALPVGHLAAPDCALIMWATAPLLPDAIELMRAWVHLQISRSMGETVQYGAEMGVRDRVLLPFCG